jgi:beta-lactamase regulating signal transducer with metallopeptidase domain
MLFNYLLESSLCLILFMATYRMLIASLTHFSWIRFYLISSVILSLVLPLIIIPIQWQSKLISAESFTNVLQLTTKQTGTVFTNNHVANSSPANSWLSVQLIVVYCLLTVYLIGFLYKTYSFAKNLKNIYDFIKKNPRIKEANYWIVSFKSEIPAFSFFNFIFLNKNFKDLSDNDLQTIKNHEMIHANQYHTLDILFIELVGVLFWFHPLMNYVKKSLHEIHEYIVDEKIAGNGENKKAYARLLLNLASETKVFNLVANFTGEDIKHRIQMLAKPRTSPKYKLMFIILVPLTAMLLLSFSCLKNPKANSNPDSYREQNEVTGIQLQLKKYCGVYLPTKRNYDKSLEPMEIIVKGNKLFANTTGELHFESDSIFSYTDNKARRVLFWFDNKKEVTGCALVKFVTQEHSNYLVLEGGEYSKHKQGKSEK